MALGMCQSTTSSRTNMVALSFVFLSFLVQVVYSYEPPICRGVPQTNPKDCCTIPNYFPRDVLVACGLQPDGSPPDRHDVYKCSKSICAFRRMNLINDDNILDKEGISDYMQRFVLNHPEFADAVRVAKKRCWSRDAPGPPRVCDPDRTIHCISHVIFDLCPRWKDTKNCRELRDFLEECKPYRSY